MSDSKPPKTETPLTIEEWLEVLKRSDRAFYNMMAMEVWAIAKTLDSLIPGFWTRFMANRQVAVKEFVKQKRSKES